jgi:hypothetical protein
MRTVVVALSMSLLGACTFQPGAMEHRSSVYTSARGVALHEDGESAQVGMSGTTCEVQTPSGLIGADYEYDASADERVADYGVVNGVPQVAVVTPGTIHLQDVDNTWGSDVVQVGVPGVRDVRLHDGGLIVLAEVPSDDISVAPASTLTWIDLGIDTPAEITLGNGVDVGGFTSDPITGQAWVATSDGVVSVTPNGAEPIGIAADIVAWDATSQALYVAERNSRTVRALEIDGAERWSVELEGIVQSITDLGIRGAAAVSIRKYAGHGEVVILDGESGELLDVLLTPESASEMTASGDGDTVAVVTPGAVHFYNAAE